MRCQAANNNMKRGPYCSIISGACHELLNKEKRLYTHNPLSNPLLHSIFCVLKFCWLTKKCLPLKDLE